MWHSHVLAPLQNTPLHTHAAGATGSLVTPPSAAPALPRVCLLGPHPTTRAEKDVPSGCCCLLSRKISRNSSFRSWGLPEIWWSLVLELPTTPTPQPQSVSEDVCLGVVTNFCLQEAFQTINPSPVIESSIIKNRYLPIVERAFCTTSLLCKIYLSTCFHEMKKKKSKENFCF